MVTIYKNRLTYFEFAISYCYKAVFKRNGQVERTRYYMGDYEREVDANGTVTHHHYVSGPMGLVAMVVTRGGADSIFYVHPDRLGSITHITNSAKQVVRALHFDPWGNVKSDADWTVFADTVLADTSRHFRLERGFTGHEHYTELKIINMNGRLYDPVIARFFSPDNFVQAPGSTQGYNRYSYCLNNPLKWVDPSGEVSLTPWYLDLIGFVHWIDHMDEMPSYGIYLGKEGCFVSNDEMKYYHADGRITQLDIPEVIIDGTITSTPFPNKYTDSQYDYSEKNNNNILNSQVVDITLNAVGVVSSVVSEEGKGVLKYTVEGVGWITYGTQNARVAKNIYENKRLTIEDSYDLVTTNVGFWGGPGGEMIAFTLDMYKRAAIWISNYYSELEMELRRMNTPEIFY